MSCKYCDVKCPREDAVIGIGHRPIGKPFFTNRDENGVYAWAAIVHDDGCQALPDEDEWRIYCMDGGFGHYIDIDFCPVCGERLGDGE